jgi:NADPH2:quinone reductase
MSTKLPDAIVELRSRATEAGDIEVFLQKGPVPELTGDQVLIRIEATPINPSDLGLLWGPADFATLKTETVDGLPLARAVVPEHLRKMIAARVGQALPVGNEGAGVVIAAGPDAQGMIGKVVAALGGTMYASHRVARAQDVLQFPEGVTPREAAAPFVNPLTTLGFIGTMRAEGHKALVHTAAASNLGLMLNRLCQAEGVDLVNVVRKPEQAEILRAEGAKYVVDSSEPDFKQKLVAALAETGATLCFDAIGGGRLASDILESMEIAANQGATYSRYGSTVHKQVYRYGVLDTSPTELRGSFGMAWGIGGWLLTPFLMKQKPEEVAALRARVAREIKTTFASRYGHEISLSQVVDPDTARAYNAKATGAKYLINPSLG